MSITTALNTTIERKSQIIQAINSKGVELSNNANLADCAVAIASIQTSERKYTGSADIEGLRRIGWTDQDILNYQIYAVNWNEDQNHSHKVNQQIIDLYASSEKTMIDGVEMATGANFDTFKLSPYCNYFPKVDVSQLGNIQFQNCYNIVAIPSLNYSVTSASSMFYNCSNLTYVDIRNITNPVTSMYRMFANCYNLIYLDLSTLDTTEATSMLSAFENCYSVELDLRSFDTRKVTTMSNCFKQCFGRIRLGDGFYLDKISFGVTNAPFASGAPLSFAASCDFECVRSVLAAFARSNNSFAFSINFAVNSTVIDRDNELNDLKTAVERKGFSTTNLNIVS